MKYFFVLSFFISFHILADFNNRWQGAGVNIYDGSRKKCELIFLHMKKDATTFSILDGGYQCGDLHASYPFSIFQIKGNSLYYQGVKAGQIYVNMIEIYNQNEGFNLRLNIKADGHLEYQEAWITDSTPFIVTGKLLPFDSFR